MADAEAALSGPSVRPLRNADAAPLARLLRAQRQAYMAHFGPFAFEASVIEQALAQARRDRYWRLDLDGRMVGFAMLRGLDQGYARPSFGVFVAEHARGKGVARTALLHALDWARARPEIPEVMLRVAPENRRAWNLYRSLGFVPDLDTPPGEQVIMRHVLLRDRDEPR